jgi:hypothetical protein
MEQRAQTGRLVRLRKYGKWGSSFEQVDYRLNLSEKEIGGLQRDSVQDNCSSAWVRTPFYTRWARVLYALALAAIAPHRFPMPHSSEGGVRHSVPLPFCAAQRYAGVKRRRLTPGFKDTV